MKILILAFLITSVPCSTAEKLPNSWEGFDYEMAGLSRQEFAILQKSNLSEESFYELMKLGVKPSEYLSKPWLKLGINEEEWWTQKKMGMSDEDMDQSWKSRYTDRNQAWLSLLIPGYYQYNHHQPLKGALVNTLNILGLSAWLWTEFALKDPRSIHFAYLAATGNIYSFVDAWLQVKPVVEQPSNDHFVYSLPKSTSLGIAFSFRALF